MEKCLCKFLLIVRVRKQRLLIGVREKAKLHKGGRDFGMPQDIEARVFDTAVVKPARRRKFLVGMPLGSAPITVLAATASPAVAAWAVAGIGWLGAAWV